MGDRGVFHDIAKLCCLIFASHVLKLDSPFLMQLVAYPFIKGDVCFMLEGYFTILPTFEGRFILVLSESNDAADNFACF